MKKTRGLSRGACEARNARLARSIHVFENRFSSQSTRGGRTALIPTNVGAVEDVRIFILGAQSQESAEGASIHFAIVE